MRSQKTEIVNESLKRQRKNSEVRNWKSKAKNWNSERFCMSKVRIGKSYHMHLDVRSAETEIGYRELKILVLGLTSDFLSFFFFFYFLLRNFRLLNSYFWRLTSYFHFQALTC